MMRGEAYPTCPKCREVGEDGVVRKANAMVPLSDYAPEGASVTWKAWVCLDDQCGYVVRVDKGDVSYGKATDRYQRRETYGGGRPR